MYHSIADEAAPRFERFVVPPHRFAAQLERLSERGYVGLTVSQLVGRARAGSPLPPRVVALTFDDGYADFSTTALPLLHRYGFPATLYVATAYVGGSSRWLVRERETQRPMLSWEQILAAQNAGIEIGAHSHDHAALDVLAPGQLLYEVRHCRALLEARLGGPVTSFAYPFGYASRMVKRAVAEAGYTSACAVGYRLSEPGGDPLNLQRCIVTRETQGAALDRLLELGQPRRAAAVALSRPAWRAVRRIAAYRHGSRSAVGAVAYE